MPRRITWVLLALAAAWLVFLGGGLFGIYTTELRVVTVSLATVIVLGWAIAAWRDPRWRPQTAMWPAIGACLGSLAISTAFSRFPRVSLEYLGYAILLAALYLLLVQLMARPFFRDRLVALGAIFFVIVSVEYVVAVGYLWIQWWGNVGHIAVPPLRPNSVGLTYGNPSAALTIAALFAMPAAARWSSWTARGVAAFVAIVLTVGVVAILSGSRSGWFALAIAGGLGVVAGVASREVRERVAAAAGGRVTLPRWARIACVVAVVGVVALAVVTLPGILLRVENTNDPYRPVFWRIALQIFGESPLVGTGPGTWVIQRIAYTQPPELDYYIPHAHDVPLQTLAEQGVVGAIAGAVLLANLGWLMWSAARSIDGTRRRWAWITALGLIYLTAHDLLDFYPNFPGILFAAALPVAYLDGTRLQEHSKRATPVSTRGARSRAQALRGGALLVGLIAVVSATGGLLAQEVPSHEQDLAIGAGAANDWTGALEQSSRAAAADPAISPYQFMAGFAAAQLGRHADAVAYFSRVAKQDDYPAAWLDLAVEQAALGDKNAALAAVRRALRIGVTEAQIAIPAGDLALRLGDSDLAVNAFAGGIANVPSLAGDAWWLADPARAALFPRILQTANDEASADAKWEIAMVTGDSAEAQRLAATVGNPAQTQRVIAAWNGDHAAFDALFADCEAHPLDFSTVAWCARLENRRGNRTEAARFRDILDGYGQGGAADGLELRVVTADVKGGYLAPTSLYGWFFYTYRRYGPVDMLLPGLVHLRYA